MLYRQLNENASDYLMYRYFHLCSRRQRRVKDILTEADFLYSPQYGGKYLRMTNFTLQPFRCLLVLKKGQTLEMVAIWKPDWWSVT